MGPDFKKPNRGGLDAAEDTLAAEKSSMATDGMFATHILGSHQRNGVLKATQRTPRTPCSRDIINDLASA